MAAKIQELEIIAVALWEFIINKDGCHNTGTGNN